MIQCFFLLSCLVLALAVQFLVFLVLQSSRWGRESWLLYFNCLLDAMWLLVLCVSSSWCWGLVSIVWLWRCFRVKQAFFLAGQYPIARLLLRQFSLHKYRLVHQYHAPSLIVVHTLYVCVSSVGTGDTVRVHPPVWAFTGHISNECQNLKC